MEKKNYTLRIRALYKFLKKHRLFDSYLANVIKQHPYNREVKLFLENGNIMDLLAANGNIDHSFCWSGTPQGHRFWEELNNCEIREYREYERAVSIMHQKEC